MSDEPSSDSTNSGMTEQDFDRLMLPGWRWLGTMFVVLVFILSGLFYWFTYRMNSNSMILVREARATIDRGDTFPSRLTPRTLEMEEYAERTLRERDRILSQLLSDSFPRMLRSTLKQRYRKQSPYYRLPDDWMDRLPSDLQSFARQKRQKRRREIQQFLGTIPGLHEAQKQRFARVEALQESMSLDPALDPFLDRFRRFRGQVLDEFQELRETLNRATLQSARIPPPVYRELVDLLDPMGELALRYRRFAALTSAPASYVYAEQTLKDALRIDPNNAEAFFQLGRVYERMNMPVVSAEFYARSLKTDPDFHRRKQIIERFRRRLEEKPNSPRRHYDLAFALHETGDVEEARQHLRKVLQLEAGSRSMVRVLALKRLGYIRYGESLYNKLTLF